MYAHMHLVLSNKYFYRKFNEKIKIRPPTTFLLYNTIWEYIQDIYEKRLTVQFGIRKTLRTWTAIDVSHKRQIVKTVHLLSTLADLSVSIQLFLSAHKDHLFNWNSFSSVHLQWGYRISTYFFLLAVWIRFPKYFAV